jgi:hypothetical protein
MSKNEKNKSFELEKSSNFVVISKNRLSSAKNGVNYMILKEGEIKLNYIINKDKINKSDINKIIKTLKSFSKSDANFGNYKNIDIINKNKLTQIKKRPLIKFKSNYAYETTRSNNYLLTTENNDDMQNKKTIEENKVKINRKEDQEINIKQIIDDMNNKEKIMTQNFFTKRNEIKNLTSIDMYLNKSKKSSDKAAKSITEKISKISSLPPKFIFNALKNIDTSNSKNEFPRLITEYVENEKNSIKTKNDLISESQTIHIDENSKEESKKKVEKDNDTRKILINSIIQNSLQLIKLKNYFLFFK